MTEKEWNDQVLRNNKKMEQEHREK
jgi:hypothetical protein